MATEIHFIFTLWERGMTPESVIWFKGGNENVAWNGSNEYKRGCIRPFWYSAHFSTFLYKTTTRSATSQPSQDELRSGPIDALRLWKHKKLPEELLKTNVSCLEKVIFLRLAVVIAKAPSYLPRRQLMITLQSNYKKLCSHFLRRS